MTPMEPTMDDRSTQMSSAAQASQYPPDAATSSTKACTLIPFSSASRRMRAPINADCTADPPGELITSAMAAGLPRANARSIKGASAASFRLRPPEPMVP